LKSLFPTFFKYYVFLFSGTDWKYHIPKTSRKRICLFFGRRVTTSTIISVKKVKNIVQNSRIEEFRYGQSNNWNTVKHVYTDHPWSLKNVFRGLPEKDQWSVRFWLVVITSGWHLLTGGRWDRFDRQLVKLKYGHVKKEFLSLPNITELPNHPSASTIIPPGPNPIQHYSPLIFTLLIFKVLPLPLFFLWKVKK